MEVVIKGKSVSYNKKCVVLQSLLKLISGKWSISKFRLGKAVWVILWEEGKWHLIKYKTVNLEQQLLKNGFN